MRVAPMACWTASMSFAEEALGKRSVLNVAQRRALVEIVESGPIPAFHGAVPLRQAQEAADRPGPVAP